ncbi:MAG TPA: hypothetical protein VFL62_26230 [Bradyrhizobium sp.]|uniref:hypothetical protein n=1 Tax=Bradyrhizobium sp. TaxID=376 RepID=UPI002D7FB2DC|nr:hypothetical protein [Bradyrhizobium sp.]HET7889744.1 hypothetical protein [Bradyrhizobium sp.]
MPTGVKPKATDNPHDFVVVPSDQVRVAPTDAEITDLLRAAARHHSEAATRAASDPSGSSAVPMVDATFRATDVNEGVPARSSFFRRAMRGLVALLLALGIGAAALSWQTFGYAAKKALLSWAPKWAIAVSLPLDKLGLGSNSASSSDPAETVPPQTAVAAESAPDGDTSGNVAAAVPTAGNAVAAAPPVSEDAAQQLQAMARDLANANREVETLKASIAELKASQQQTARDLAKVTDKLAEQNAKAKLAAAAPRPPVHRPTPVYSPTSYSPAATPAPPPPAYRATTSPYAAQASVAPAPPPVAAQPYAPPPMQIQPQADPGVVGAAPRPPMPVTQ